MGYLVWLYLTNILYTGIALVMFNLKLNGVALSTRNVLERNQLTSMRTAFSNMVPGVVIMFVVNMMLLNQLNADVDGGLWRILVISTGLVSLVFSFVEYFFTRERVTEENRMAHSADSLKGVHTQVPLGQQIKNLLSNKYFVMSLFVVIGALFYDAI